MRTATVALIASNVVSASVAAAVKSASIVLIARHVYGAQVAPAAPIAQHVSRVGGCTAALTA